MNLDLERLLEEQGGVATSGQLLDLVTRYAFNRMVDNGTLERLWQGIYCLGEPTVALKLSGLDLSCGTAVTVCLGTAAGCYGFDTEDTQVLHVLNPQGQQ
ncbi:MAG: hypothetical protein QOH27_1557, partial [Mycobacterium sp.]|nr:hypothetical protein [Mycobacterium sp.]